MDLLPRRYPPADVREDDVMQRHRETLKYIELLLAERR